MVVQISEFLTLALGGQWSTSRPMHTWEKSLSYLLHMMLERLQTWCSCFRQDTNILPLPAIKHQLLFHPAHSLVTMPNESSPAADIVL